MFFNKFNKIYFDILTNWEIPELLSSDYDIFKAWGINNNHVWLSVLYRDKAPLRSRGRPFKPQTITSEVQSSHFVRIVRALTYSMINYAYYI